MLLTVGLSTYSSDDRFLVEHTRHLGNWALRIKNARKDDEGIYECQLSTHPPESIFIELRIVGECKQATNKAQLFNLCGSLTTGAFIHEAIVYDAVNVCVACAMEKFHARRRSPEFIWHTKANICARHSFECAQTLNLNKQGH